MISISTKINKNIDALLIDKVHLLLGKAATEFEKEMKQEIEYGAKTGNQYQRGNNFHTASAPGQAPASDSGKLAGSIRYEKKSNDKHEVSINSEYALALEVGTSRMAARPFITPALQNAKKKLMKAIRAINKGNK
jgi:HK97 gp10 family phage protein